MFRYPLRGYVSVCRLAPIDDWKVSKVVTGAGLDALRVRTDAWRITSLAAARLLGRFRTEANLGPDFMSARLVEPVTASAIPSAAAWRQKRWLPLSSPSVSSNSSAPVSGIANTCKLPFSLRGVRMTARPWGSACMVIP